jgi:hypothetical protein
MTRTVARRQEGEEADGDGPLRRCIVTGERRPPERMIRFVEGLEHQVVPDIAHKLPGRGAWVSADRAALARACDKGLFSKALKGAVACPPDLDQQVERLLAQRCLDLLGLARRAGQAIIGFQQVEQAFRAREGRVGALVEASDSGPADRGKLVAYARREGGIPVVGCFDGREIGLAFGREYVVHAALASGPLAARFLAEAERLGGFRVLRPLDWDAA